MLGRASAWLDNEQPITSAAQICSTILDHTLAAIRHLSWKHKRIANQSAVSAAQVGLLMPVVQVQLHQFTCTQYIATYTVAIHHLPL